jgi:hypothetical protein
MNRTITAALISALVFPGAGHVYLKRTRRGLLFILPSVLALAYVFRQVLASASGIADQLLAGTLEPDVAVIVDKVSKLGELNSPMLSAAAYAIVLVWAASIIDSFIIGPKA